MSEGTVKFHVRQIMRKFGVTNRTQVAVVCGVRGFAEAPPWTHAPPRRSPRRPNQAARGVEDSSRKLVEKAAEKFIPVADEPRRENNDLGGAAAIFT
jgi:regulatory LuxR family protein